ncbi:carboxymuconolactone decarboxylase family protein [Streptomyces sp. NPDC093675]|uniref:carboxymuconolactone decarboxylase family protein n=1 Tax=Streptomyces sp. NPDC093675 TaxID=3366049 RepID=UPI0037F6753F
MSRIATPPCVEEAPESARPTLDAVGKQLGFVPNLHRLMSTSPALLSAFVGLQTPLSKTLDASTRHAISLAVSQVNECGYCLRAHTYSAATFGKMPIEDIAMARKGASTDPKRNAAVAFAKRVVETHGKVGGDELDAVREAGFTDSQVLEIVGVAVQFLLTNFINNVADTDIDFPEVEGAPAV